MLVLGAVVVVLQVPVQLQQKYPILSLAVLSWMEFFQPQKKITTFLAVQLWFIYFWPTPKICYVIASCPCKLYFDTVQLS